MAISTITYSSGQFDTSNASINPAQKTVFLIHGFMSNPNRAFGDANENSQSDLSESLNAFYEGTANIINVDWSSAAGSSGFDYSRISNTGIFYVGQALSNTFKSLNLDPNNIEIVGHSLGAHIAGIAGKDFWLQDPGLRQIKQIVGLDPAGVLFDTSGPNNRISPDDAQRVVAIHSSNVSTGLGSNNQWGLGLYRDDLGHLDIYLKQWGNVYGASRFSPNSHDLAIDVYKQFANGQVLSGSNQFGSDLNFNDFINLQKLANPDLTGEYTINLDIRNAVGGAGNDQFSGDDYSNFLQGNGGGDSLAGLAGDDLIYGDDPLNKTTGNDFLNGGTGNDMLYGGSGDDTLAGGAGYDVLYGGTGNDTAYYFDDFGATQGAVVSLIEGRAIDSFSNQDTLYEIENIIGSQNNDILIGDNFNNRIDGFFGNDTLTGLGGADTFVLSLVERTSSGSSTTKAITDFSYIEGDKINLSAGSTPVSLDQIIYNPGNGSLSFQGISFAVLFNKPQDFNVQTDISILPPTGGSTTPFGF